MLLLASALLPLLVAGVVVHWEIGGHLTAEARLRLRDAAKDYGLGVFDRLSFAADQLRWRSSLPDIADRSRTGLVFSDASLLRPDGRAGVIIGSGVSEGVRDAARRLLDHVATDATLFARPGPGESRLLLAVRTPAGIAVGELRPQYVWSRVENNPAGIDFCVRLVDDASHCPAGDPAASPEVLVGRWPLFMRAGFGIADWDVIASTPVGEALASLSSLREGGPFIFIGALLFSALLGLVQIRRRHRPLEQLLAATRRMERGQLGEPVVVESDDEYAVLGQALDRASSALRDQLELRDMLTVIDRSIIESRSPDHILARLLPGMSGMAAGAAAIAIVLQANDRSARVSVWTDALQDGTADVVGLFGCLDPDQDDLAPSVGRIAGWLESELGIAVRNAELWPLRDGQQLLGAIGWLDLPGAAAARADASGERLAQHFSVALADARYRDELLHQAYHDRLTGLPNRTLLLERLEMQCDQAASVGPGPALMFLDLDKFKVVNDSFGHSAGDALLCRVAERLKSAAPAGTVIARLGGDEFALLLDGGLRVAEAAAIATRLQEALAEPLAVEGLLQHCTASIGIAMYPVSGRDPDTLLRNADTAMYRAKARANASIAFFEDDMNRELQRRVFLDRELRAALDANAIQLAFQPKIDLANGAAAGFEVLVRWTHPTEGPISPAEFVPVAEECGLMADLGWYVLESACRHLVRWRDCGLAVLPLAVNASVRQFADAAFAEKILALLEQCDLPESWLEVEVTESTLENRYGDVLAQLSGLRRAGVRVSIDDFGTGYSSLAALQAMPVDSLKVDQAFVRNMESDPDRQAIVRAIIVMGRTLGKKVIAEGVETPEQLRLLEQLGCHEVQGYLFSRPIDAATLEQEWLRGPGSPVMADAARRRA